MDDSPVLLCAGSLNIDLLATVPYLPERDARVTSAPFVRRLGGMAGNAACAAASQRALHGLQVLLVAAIGKDSDSVWAEQTLRAQGVTTDWLDRTSIPYTPRCVILVEPDGARTLITEPTRLDYARMDACIDAYNDYQGLKLLYSEGHHLPWLEDRLQQAKRRGWRIAVDVDGLEMVRFSRDEFTKIASQADCIFLNRRYAEQLYADAGPACQAHLRNLAEQYNTLFLLTLGAQGCMLIEPDGEIFILPARKVRVQDTTGAGDVFAGVFCAALLQELPLRQAVSYANLAAGLSTTAIGATADLPDVSELQHLDRNTPYL